MTQVACTNQHYDYAFYVTSNNHAADSTRAVVPNVCILLYPKSAVDGGCGPSVWLSVFKECGVQQTFGIDGSQMDPNWIGIPRKSLRQADLSRKVELSERFDLALFTEVTEHLPPAFADDLIDLLVHAAPTVFCSTAVLYQRGTENINRQWPRYWCARLQQHGHAKLDLIRTGIWTKPEIRYVYRQNLYQYVQKDLLDSNEAFARAVPFAADLMLIERGEFETHFRLRPLLWSLTSAFRQFLRGRLARIRRRTP